MYTVYLTLGCVEVGTGLLRAEVRSSTDDSGGGVGVPLSGATQAQPRQGARNHRSLVELVEQPPRLQHTTIILTA